MVSNLGSTFQVIYLLEWANNKKLKQSAIKVLMYHVNMLRGRLKNPSSHFQKRKICFYKKQG